MWEALLSPPRGRISARQFIVLFATTLVVYLSYLVVFAPTAAAADASWEGGNIVYQGNSYAGPSDTTGRKGLKNIPSSAQLYEYTENQTAYIIFFPGGAVPKSEKEATYITYTLNPPNTYSDPSSKQTITISPATDEIVTPSDETSSCALDGIGWIVCPVTKALASTMDAIFGLIRGFLEVRPLLTTTDSPLYTAWTYARTFANICFVIAFMIIIYSQLTGVGLDNYNIKKILPKVVVSVILVNVSYWLCAIAVDIFNVLGYSIQDMFTSIRNNLVGPDSNSWELLNWESLTTFVLSGGAIAAGYGVLAITTQGAIIGALGYLLAPLLVGFLIAVVVVFIILAARQAIITIFIVLAPLAFVAMLLPNTEKWFDKWRSIFTTMLLIFPAFSVLFGGSQLASALIIQNSNTLDMLLLGLAIQIVPLAITPFLLKLSGGILNRFAGIVNNPGKGLVDRTRNWSKDKLDARNAEMRARNFEGIKNGSINPSRRKYDPRRYRSRSIAARKAIGDLDQAKQKEINEQRADNAYQTYANTRRLDTMKRTTDQEHRRVEGEHEAHWKERMRMVDNNGNRNPHFSEEIFTKEVQIKKLADQGKLADDSLESAYTEMRAGRDPYTSLGLRNNTPQQLQGDISEIALTAQKLSLEGMRRASAETLEKNNMTQTLLRDALARDYAGGVREAEGADSALASAVSKYRSDFNEKVQEKTQLMKHFNLSSGQRQNLAMGVSIGEVEKDGARYTFDFNDDYTREAMIEEQLKTGSFSQIEKIIRSSGGINRDYRLTISQAIAQNGLAKKAAYWGAKTIDDVSQGKYNEDFENEAIVYHVREGKISDELLALQSPEAIDRMFALEQDQAKMDEIRQRDPAEYNKLVRNFQNLRHASWRVIHDPQLSQTSSDATREKLKNYGIQPPPPTNNP